MYDLLTKARGGVVIKILTATVTVTLALILSLTLFEGRKLEAWGLLLGLVGGKEGKRG